MEHCCYGPSHTVSPGRLLLTAAGLWTLQPRGGDGDGTIIRNTGCTPALATCQPQDESSETIPLAPSIIHMSDEELGCPRNFRLGNFAHLPKFQGSLQKH